MTASNQPRAPRDLRLRCDARGVLRAEGEWQSRLEALRRANATHDAYWIEAARQVDAWPEQLGFGAELEADDGARWALVRMSMVEQMANLLPELQLVDALVESCAGAGLVLDDATRAARLVVRTVGASRGRAVSGTDRATQGPPIHERVARAALLGARLLLGGARVVRHRPRAGSVLSIGYTTLRRVRHAGRERMIDPYFTPVLDELARRGVPESRINLPTLYNVRQDARWLLAGDRQAIPFEGHYARWRLARRRPPYPEIARARATARAALVQRTIVWHGIDIGPLVAEVIDEALGTRLPERLELVAFFEGLMRRQRPSAVLLTSEYSGAALAARVAAMRLRIPTVGVQHGVIWRGHPGYVAPGTDPRRLARPDVLCVFGDFERELLLRESGFAPERVVATGAPRLDLLDEHGGLSRDELAAHLGLPTDPPLVLFTSAGGQSEVVASALVAGITASRSPLSVIVKLHPTYPEERAVYEAAARRANCRDVRVIMEEFDLFDLLRAADVHASTHSTVLTEAVLADTPNIMLCTGTFADTVDHLGRGVAVAVEDYGSLADAVHAVTVGPEARRLREGRAAFVREHFGPLDGKASSRVADVVERAMRAGVPARAEP